MIRVSVVVVEVSLQGLSAPSLSIPSIGTTLLFKSIAVIPAGPMLRPDTHTHPAEFVTAFSARHVIAATVLLDGGVAARAFFCMRRNPVGSLRVILALLDPLLHQCTRCWLMVVQGTAKTEGMITPTMNGRNNLVELTLLYATFNGIDTVWCRAPLQAVLVVYIGSAQQFFVSGSY